MKRASVTATLALGVLSLATLPLPATATPATAPPAVPAPVLVAPYDFDGNGVADLTVGAPDLTVGATRDAGGVFVYPSSSAGPADRPTLLTRADHAALGAPEPGDAFGTVLASADFDDDGYADLAVGQPGRDLPQGVDAGTVTVFYGSATGLDGARVVDLPVPGGDRAGARFGAALAAADLDADGYPDLAVGAPGDDVQRNPHHPWAASGSVRVYPGGKHGLSAKRYDKRHGRRGTGSSGFDVGFGGLLAVGDLNLDGISDLVVGAPGESYVGTRGYAGWFDVCRGGRGGVSACRRPSLPHAKGYTHGWSGMTSLVVAHADHRYRRPQVIIGSPHFADGERGEVWLVQLTRSTRAVHGFDAFRPQDVPGFPAAGSEPDRFGQSVALAPMQDLLSPLLVIGSPGADGGRGAVATVLLDVDTQGRYSYAVYDQRTAVVPGGSAPGNRFGTSVGLVDHDGNGQPELDVGVPGEDLGTGAAVHLTYDPAVRFRSADLVTPGVGAGGSRFGSTLDR